MAEEQTKQENDKNSKEIDLNKLFPKKVKFNNLKIKQKYIFTRAGKTKIS
jgi:hypothetical protein